MQFDRRVTSRLAVRLATVDSGTCAGTCPPNEGPGDTSDFSHLLPPSQEGFTVFTGSAYIQMQQANKNTSKTNSVSKTKEKSGQPKQTKHNGRSVWEQYV